MSGIDNETMSAYGDALADIPTWEAPATPRFRRASLLRIDLPLPEFPALHLPSNDDDSAE
jgi:hypothetical protein